MTTPTPGPWTWEREDSTAMTLQAPSGTVLSIYESHGGGEHPTEADASLIAAAPELLDLLKRAVRYCPVEVQDQMYAVIAKAEGTL